MEWISIVSLYLALTISLSLCLLSHCALKATFLEQLFVFYASPLTSLQLLFFFIVIFFTFRFSFVFGVSLSFFAFYLCCWCLCYECTEQSHAFIFLNFIQFDFVCVNLLFLSFSTRNEKKLWGEPLKANARK